MESISIPNNYRITAAKASNDPISIGQIVSLSYIDTETMEEGFLEFVTNPGRVVYMEQSDGTYKKQVMDGVMEPRTTYNRIKE